MPNKHCFSLSFSHILICPSINTHFNTYKHACGKLQTPTRIPDFIDGQE